MIRLTRIAATVAFATVAAASTAEASGLRGSPASMRQQHSVARQHDFTFLRTPDQVRKFADAGRLDTVPGNADYAVNKVSFPYARPEVLQFIERLARQYREATGEKLVVTSLTRPKALQPRNAHKLSVHPAGMAVDLRVPARADSRQWLETKLLTLEAEGLLDVTREKRPPHYHVAVFPEQFGGYAEANPLPPRPLEPKAAPEQTTASVLAELSPRMGAPLMGVQQAGANTGFGGWGFAALAGVVLAGGAVARRRIPVKAIRKE